MSLLQSRAPVSTWGSIDTSDRGDAEAKRLNWTFRQDGSFVGQKRRVIPKSPPTPPPDGEGTLLRRKDVKPPHTAQTERANRAQKVPKAQKVQKAQNAQNAQNARQSATPAPSQQILMGSNSWPCARAHSKQPPAGRSAKGTADEPKDAQHKHEWCMQSDQVVALVLKEVLEEAIEEPDLLAKFGEECEMALVGKEQHSACSAVRDYMVEDAPSQHRQINVAELCTNADESSDTLEVHDSTLFLSVSIAARSLDLTRILRAELRDGA
jgi:hypothetical protein